MTATREQDEVILRGLWLLKKGLTTTTVASIVGKDRANLMKSMKNVFTADMSCGDHPADILPHYPSSMRPNR